MKKYLITGLLALITFLTLQISSVQASDKVRLFGERYPDVDWFTLEIVNKTGSEIKEVYIASSGSNKWDRIVINQMIKNGEQKTISYHVERQDLGPEDIKVVSTSQQSPLFLRGYDLPGIDTFTIHFNHTTGKASAEIE